MELKSDVQDDVIIIESIEIKSYFQKLSRTVIFCYWKNAKPSLAKSPMLA